MWLYLHEKQTENYLVLFLLNMLCLSWVNYLLICYLKAQKSVSPPELIRSDWVFCVSSAKHYYLNNLIVSYCYHLSNEIVVYRFQVCMINKQSALFRPRIFKQQMWTTLYWKHQPKYAFTKTFINIWMNGKSYRILHHLLPAYLLQLKN